MAPRKTKTTTSVKTTTKKNPWRSSHVPLPSWIMFWALVLCTMALIVVNFSKAFEPVQVDAIDDQTAAQFAAIRASLEQQINDLQGQVSSSTTPSVLACVTVQNPGPADSHVLYVDPKTHVSMSLPYSTSWGNGCAAVQSEEDGIHFGPNLEASLAVLDPKSIPAFYVKIDRTVSGLKVYKPGDMVTFAVGKTYAYRIQTKGWLTDAEINKIIQSLKVVK